MATAEILTAAVQQHLGSMVWWDLAHTRITPADLRAVLAAEGDAATVPDIDQPAAARRAIRAWSLGRGSADRYRAEVVYDEAGHLVAGVLRREQVAEKEARWVQVGRVGYTVQGDLLLYDWHDGEETAGVVEAITGVCTHLDHTWIRPFIQDRLDGMASFRLRRAGGVEFVPHVYRPDVERLARVVRRIGTSSFEIADIAATESSRESVGTAAREAVSSAIGEINERLDKWAESARNVSDRSYASVLEAFGDVALRTEMYADALEVSVGDVRVKLDAAKARMLALLTDGPEADREAA